LGVQDIINQTYLKNFTVDR